MADPEKPGLEPRARFGGSCACRRITYTCSSLPHAGKTTACHCVSCRKLSGGPYQAYTRVTSKDVTFLDNEQHLRYEGLPKDDIGGIVFVRLSASGERAYCAACYSPLAMRFRHEPEFTSLTLGSVDEDSILDAKCRAALGLAAHIFTTQMAWWNTSEAGLPHHDRFP